MNTAAFPAAFDGSLLRACEEHADTPMMGLRVFTTYAIAQAHGWEEARRRLSRSSWFKHKKLLSCFGIPVPTGEPPEGSNPLPSEGGYWFGAVGALDVVAKVTESPILVTQLVNTRFRVALPWRDLGVWCTTDRHELEAWPVGSEGVVCSVIFEGRWAVEIEHDDWRLPDEERWPRVPLGDFLQRTRPLERPHRG